MGPPVNEFDASEFERGNDIRFPSVGYGVQKSLLDASSWKEAGSRTRHMGNPNSMQINTGFAGVFSILLPRKA